MGVRSEYYKLCAISGKIVLECNAYMYEPNWFGHLNWKAVGVAWVTQLYYVDYIHNDPVINFGGTPMTIIKRRGSVFLTIDGGLTKVMGCRLP